MMMLGLRGPAGGFGASAARTAPGRKRVATATSRFTARTGCSFLSLRRRADRVEGLEAAEVDAAAGDRRRGGGFVDELVDRQQLELRPGLDDRHGAVAGGEVDLAVGVDRR